MHLKTEFHTIGGDSPPYMIAEIGLNHNGSLDLAKKMCEAALKSGAHAAKFQLYNPGYFIAENAKLGDGMPLRDFFGQFCLKEEEWISLSEYVRSMKMDFFCSVFDEVSLEFYRNFLNPSLVKTASSDVNNRPLIEKASSLGLPLIVSAGTASENEVEAVCQWVKDKNSLMFMHCVSSYPAKPADFNLKVIPVWKEKFGCPIALSDHTEGDTVSIAAVALGASAVEKHFTLDKSLPGPDQKLSADPADFKRLADAVRDTHESLGDGVKKCMESESPVREFGRRSLYSLSDIREGDIFSGQNMILLRPGGGMGAEKYHILIGKKASRNYKKGDRLEEPL